MNAAITLYFAPLACSLATRIALYEAGAPATFTQVDTRTKRLVADGSDYLAINPMGQVPALAVGGEILTENSAILQYVADRFREAKLLPASGLARAQVQRWLSFIGTELHKVIFTPLFDRKASDGVRAYTREQIAPRFGILQSHLASRTFLHESFSIADAYLATILNWTSAVDIDLKQWAAVHEYHQRIRERPSISKAFGEEMALYKQEQARQA